MSWESDAQFASLTDEGRRKVRERIDSVERILKAKPRGHAVAREAALLGICGSAMRRLVTLYTRSGGKWQSLIDHRGEPHSDDVLPPAFKEFWKMLCEDNQRKSKPAWRELRRIYRSGAGEYTSPRGWTMRLWPGYDERPEPSVTSRDGMPVGWSYSNLILPGNGLTQLERREARLGPIAASELLPMVFTSRRNLRPGQYYVFDDRWNDLKCLLPGRMTKPVRSIELSAGDVFSGKTVVWGLIPLVEGDDNRRRQITGDYMRMLLVDLLCHKGFHRDGCTLLVEHGTAAIPVELELILCALSGGVVKEGRIIQRGRIRVLRSGIKGGVSFAGGFPTLGKGNFRFKAGWESTHSLKHNELANLPGQVGKNSRLEIVEELDGREKWATKLMLAATETRPETARVLLSGAGFLPFSELFWSFNRVLRQIDGYTDHQLEGWREAGLVTSEYRLDPQGAWMPMAALTRYEAQHRQAIEAFLATTPWALRERQFSRDEAWQSGKRELERMPLHIAPAIFGEKMSVVRRVNDAVQFKFTRAEIGDDDLYYQAIAEGPHGEKVPLAPGSEYRTWVNDLNPAMLFVSALTGNYLGVCKLIERHDKQDDEAIKRESGQAAKMAAEFVEPHYRRALRRNAQRTRDNKQTVAVLGGAPITEAEQQLERDRANRAANREEKLDPAALAGVAATEPADDEEPPDFSNLA